MEKKGVLKVARFKLYTLMVAVLVLWIAIEVVLTLITPVSYLLSIMLLAAFCGANVVFLFNDPFSITYGPEGLVLNYYRHERAIPWSDIEKVEQENRRFGLTPLAISLSDGEKIKIEGKVENKGMNIMDALTEFREMQKR